MQSALNYFVVVYFLCSFYPLSFYLFILKFCSDLNILTI